MPVAIGCGIVTKLFPIQNGTTALYISCQEGRLDIVQLLLQSGAQDIPRKVCTHDCASSLIMHACSRNYIDSTVYRVDTQPWTKPKYEDMKILSSCSSSRGTLTDIEPH